MIVSVWNPHVIVLPMLAFVIVAAALARPDAGFCWCGRRAGILLVQTRVAMVPSWRCSAPPRSSPGGTDSAACGWEPACSPWSCGCTGHGAGDPHSATSPESSRSSPGPRHRDRPSAPRWRPGPPHRPACSPGTSPSHWVSISGRPTLPGRRCGRSRRSSSWRPPRCGHGPAPTPARGGSRRCACWRPLSRSRRRRGFAARSPTTRSSGCRRSAP